MKRKKYDFKNIFIATLKVFLEFFKLGLISFGGGMAMVSMLEEELVEKKKWVKKDELVDMIAISESTPGPVAINMATYVGFNMAGIFGSIFATIGVVLPSFIIIFLISLFFEQFLALTFVQYAFEGIQVAIVFIIFKAGINLLKNIKKDPVSITMFIVTMLIEIIITIFAFEFSSIYLILAGGIIGIIYYGLIKGRKIKTERKKDQKK